MKDAFKEKGFLLSAAVGAGKGTIDTAYEVPEIAKYILGLIKKLSIKTYFSFKFV